MTFTDCTFENNLKTAIKALGSNLIKLFNATSPSEIIVHSYYNYGGRIANSGIFLNRPTHIVSADNYAKYKGGAI